MIEQWVIREPKNEQIEYAVVALTGRGVSAESMMQITQDFQLPKTVLVALQPYNYQWYPQPFSAENQQEAVQGLPTAKRACVVAINRVQRAFQLKANKVAVVGFSAGGVMALQVAIYTRIPFAAAVSMCGAILEPNRVPTAKEKTTPIMLIHNWDDRCFDWFERYKPTRQALLDHGYDITRKEHQYGGHMITISDVISASHFIADKLGIGDWRHPRYEQWKIWKTKQRWAKKDD